MKALFFAATLFLSFSSFAQLSDDFSDGDFSSSPVWSGDDAYFEVESEKLNSNGPDETATIHLSTPSQLFDYTRWEFLLDLRLSPSASNRVRVYLLSDQADLEGDLNGYFIQVGQSGDDEIDFYRQDGSSTSLLFTGTTAFSGEVLVRIEVKRDVFGSWSIAADSTGGSDFSAEGDSFLDDTYTESNYFGIHVNHTKTQKTNYYFDDFIIEEYAPPFDLSLIKVESNNQLRLSFTQNLDETSTQNTSNYVLSNGFGHPESAEVNLDHPDQLLLTYSDDFANNSYQFTLHNLVNESLDETLEEVNKEIQIETVTAFRQIVINEIYADYNPSAAGLPDEEYIELFNLSDFPIQLQDFSVNGQQLSTYEIASKSYVIVVDESNVSEFENFGEVVTVSSFPSLVNGGMLLELKDNLGNLVDSLTYSSSWYQDESKKDGGFSLEQINPERLCNYQGNWMASGDEKGGTPGAQNSVYDNTPDQTPPTLTSLSIVDPSHLVLKFDEPMDVASLENADYSLEPGLGVLVLKVDRFGLELELSSNLVSGNIYNLSVQGATDCAGNLIELSEAFLYDVESPKLVDYELRSDRSIQLRFDEVVSEDLDEAFFEVSPFLSIEHVEVKESSNIEVSFGNSFDEHLDYSFSFSGLKDTLRNVSVDTTSVSFSYTSPIDSLYVLSGHHLKISFRPEIGENSVSNPDNYRLTKENIRPISAFHDKEENAIHLLFQSDFAANKSIEIYAENILDSSGDYLPFPYLTFIYDTDPPAPDSIIVLNETSLTVHFDEQLEKQSAQTLQHFEYEDHYPISALLEPNQREVKLVFEAPFEPEREFELLVAGVKDRYGNEMKSRKRVPFVFDKIAPRLDSVFALSGLELMLWFHESLDAASVLDTSHYQLGEVLPLEAKLDLEFDSRVVLRFGTSMGTGLKTLHLDGVMDQSGNVLKNYKTKVSLDQFLLTTLQLMASNELYLSFNQALGVSALDISSYQLTERSIQTVEEWQSGVKISFSPSLQPGKNDTLLLSLKSATGGSLANPEHSLLFDPQFETTRILNEHSVELLFSRGLDSPSLRADMFRLNDAYPSSASFSGDDSRRVNLFFSLAFEENKTYQLFWEALQDEFGRWIPAYGDTLYLDSQAPRLVEHKVLNEQELVLRFSEPLEEQSVHFYPSYFVAGLAVAKVNYQEGDSRVTLSFEEVFEYEKDYELKISGLADLSENLIADTTISFIYHKPYVPRFGELIISEIKASGDNEFFELYNSSGTTVNLRGLEFRDDNEETSFVTGEIAAGEYIMVNRSSSLLSKWLSLNNGGENLSIWGEGQLIFSISYDEDWYGSEDANQYSLEMVDLSNFCSRSNWTASSLVGGTPGYSNSQQAENPDNFGPKILQASLEGEELLIEFDEKLKPVDDFSEKLALDPESPLSNISLSYPETDRLMATLARSLESNRPYELTLTGVTDCVGNPIPEEAGTAVVYVPDQPDSLDVLISEILFNPKPGGVDFVELYNHSDKILDLQDWVIEGERSSAVITTSHYFVLPEQFVVLTSDVDLLAANYPDSDLDTFLELGAFPSFNDDEGLISLVSSDGQVLDRFEYDADIHNPLLDEEEGVSLERISFDAPTQDQNNWQSASSNAHYATPGKVNSQAYQASKSQQELSVSPKVFQPGTGLDDFTTINYQLDQPGSLANIYVFDSYGRKVRSLAKNQLLSTSGFVTWDGSTDAGSRADIGYYIVFAEIYDAKGNKQVIKETVVLGGRL